MNRGADEKAILLASGGLDSTVLAYWLMSRNVEFLPVFVDYGQHSKTKELETLKRVLPERYVERMHTIDLSSVYKNSTSRVILEADLWTESIQDSDLHLPARNLLMLSAAVAFAATNNRRKVYAAFIETHRAPGEDCSDVFFELLMPLLSHLGDVMIDLPFSRMSKAEVAKVGVDLMVPIGLTFSCLASSEIPCGACPNCVDRNQAFDALFFRSL